MNHSKTWDLISLASIPLIMTLGNSMLIPILPMIQSELSLTSFQVSMIITLYSVVAIIMIPIAGYLSDIWGRKKIIIPSLLITGIGGLIAGLAAWLMSDSYWMILLGRMIQGVGAAGASPIVLPLIGDMYKRDAEISASLGIIETTNTFGKVVSPVLGAFLATFIWFAPFWAIPIFSLLSLLMVLFLVKSPQEKKEEKEFVVFLKSIHIIFRREGRWLFGTFFIGVVDMFLLFGILFYLSSILEETYRMDGLFKGLVLAIPLLALCLTSYITGKVIGNNKWRMKWIIVAGLFLATAAVFFIAFFPAKLWLLILALSLHGIGIGATLPCLDALITEGISKEQRGTITSIYSSMRFIGVAAGPPVVALILGLSTKVLFFSFSGIGFVAMLITLIAVKPKNPVENPYWKKMKP